MNPYQVCLELAGAEVHAYEDFGSYQGDWWAKVTHKGQTGYITGKYGSCAGCDAFRDEFDYASHGDEEGNFHGSQDLPVAGCKQCDALRSRMAEFGRDYLDDIKSFPEAIQEASKYIAWDVEAAAMVRWIQEVEATPLDVVAKEAPK